MNKRKVDDFDLNINIDTINQLLINNMYKIYNNYSNPLNCDKILLLDNHIYFNSTINDESIKTLILYINTIISNQNILNNKTIILHINSKGGLLKSLVEFINYKQTCNYEIFSIIDKECQDIGIILASICNYRIINKNANCKFSKITENSYFWNYFQQCNNDTEEIKQFKNTLDHIFTNIIESKLTLHKLNAYFEKGCIWDAKKYKKLGLADEII
jgi:ATP-dependent protease ClpP protease subunit